MTVPVPHTHHPLVGDLSQRIIQANDRPVLAEGDYILVVLQRALRGADNPVLEAAIAHAYSLGLGILVYSELEEANPHASDRLFYFALGALRSLAVDLARAGVPCVQAIRPGEGAAPLAGLITAAAAIYTNEDPTHWDRAKLQRVLDAAAQAVFFVDASRLVPVRQLPEGLKTTPEFRKVHGRLRERCAALRKKTSEEIAELTPQVAQTKVPVEGPLENFANCADEALITLIAQCKVDHSIPISKDHPPTQAAIASRLATLKAEILARYKWIRNNPALEYSTSQLSPYLHFGMLSPGELYAEIASADVPKSYTWKFRDEFLTWREWSHYRAFHVPNLHEFESLTQYAQQTLRDHADDPRPERVPLEDILQGNTADPTWNAAQREWLHTGWLHNNLRMYWAKQLLRFTETPEAAWKTACYLNDHLSLDGRDPATYASMQWAFGDAKRGYSNRPIYGWVAPKSDRAILKRKGMAEWIEARL
ncbi:MAG: deoxyribodipyrimidine photo-lyase [Cyanobacteria bacterium P01_A01_bin.135]